MAFVAVAPGLLASTPLQASWAEEQSRSSFCASSPDKLPLSLLLSNLLTDTSSEAPTVLSPGTPCTGSFSDAPLFCPSLRADFALPRAAEMGCPCPGGAPWESKESQCTPRRLLPSDTPGTPWAPSLIPAPDPLATAQSSPGGDFPEAALPLPLLPTLQMPPPPVAAPTICPKLRSSPPTPFGGEVSSAGFDPWDLLDPKDPKDPIEPREPEDPPGRRSSSLRLRELDLELSDQALPVSFAALGAVAPGTLLRLLWGLTGSLPPG